MRQQLNRDYLPVFYFFLTTFLGPLLFLVLGAVVMVVFLLKTEDFCFLLDFPAVPALVAAGFFALGMFFRVSCNSLSFEASLMSASRCRSSQ